MTNSLAVTEEVARTTGLMTDDLAEVTASLGESTDEVDRLKEELARRSRQSALASRAYVLGESRVNIRAIARITEVTLSSWLRDNNVKLAQSASKRRYS